MPGSSRDGWCAADAGTGELEPEDYAFPLLQEPLTLEHGRALLLVLTGGLSRPCPLELPAQVLSLSLFSYCTTGVIAPTCKG